MPANPSLRITGFSLVELSIVLVVVGLLTGGVLGGKSLIRASELRSISADMGKYQGAIIAFRTKYNGLPGDMSNASSYWPNQCVDIAGNTCNGNSDGKITIRDITVENKWCVEQLRAWQTLALSGLVEGAYTGNWPIQAQLTVPAARSGLGLYYINYITLSGRTGNAIQFSNGLSSAAANIASSGAVTPSINYGDCYEVSGQASCASSSAIGGKDESAMVGGSTLKPLDAFNIDSKMDDGVPNKGDIRGNNGYQTTGSLNTGCTATSGGNTTYDKYVNTTQCIVAMFLEN